MTTTSDVPAPVGAAELDEWSDVGTPEQFRIFRGPKRIVRWRDAESGHRCEAITYVAGTQAADGTIEARGVRLEGIDWTDSLTAAGARELSRALESLAAEIGAATV